MRVGSLLRRLSRSAQRKSGRPAKSRQERRLNVESLEDRNLLSTWTALSNLAPEGINTMMMLSDGTVMAQGAGVNNHWYRLTADSSGSFTSGSWTSRASMGTPRLYYGSNILKDGRVFLVGGEYTNAGQVWTNTGEIYDPVANSWSAIANFPNSQFGDDPTEILPDGRILAGYLSGPQTYIYDPATNSWSFAANKLRSDASDEESWAILPDHSILSYDIFSSISLGTGHAQRYVPSSNTWVDTGTVPVALSSSGLGFELGGEFLLPDGRVFVVGANNNTAIYTPSSNTWVAGPTLPAGMGADDAPGAVMPNGHVLLAADTPLFNAPTKLFDFDPVANTITAVSTPASLTSQLNGQPAFNTRMLVLPSGQVLLSTGGNQLWAFTPDGSPADAWRPTITNISDNLNGTYTLTGTQLNGLSEGAGYGDDAEMSSNFPIIQVTDPSGVVRYARTSNWSNTGVATGSTPVSVTFTMPSGAPNVNSIAVIANGISSNVGVFVQGTGGNDTITLDTFTFFGFPFVSVNLNGNATSWFAPGFVGVTTGDGSDTVNVLDTWNFTTTSITSGFSGDTINIGNSGSVQGIGGPVNIDNPPSFDTINIDDSADGTFRNVLLSSFVPTGDSTFGSLTGLAPGAINYEYADTRDVNIRTGSGNDTVTITATGGIGTTTFIGNSHANVFVGNGNMQGLLGDLSFDNPPSFFDITFDDSANTTGLTATLDTFTPSGDSLFGRITGLSPGTMTYEIADTTSPVKVKFGSGGDVVNVLSTPAFFTTNLIGTAATTFNVGNAGSVQGINGTLNIDNPPNFNNINIDDSADTTARTVTLTSFVPSGDSTFGQLTGLAPGTINYEYADTRDVTIRTGSGGDVISVLATGGIGTTSFIGNSFATVNIGNSGSVQGINSPLVFDNSPSSYNITIDDSTDSTARTVTVDTFTPSGDSEFGRVSGLAPASISYEIFDTTNPINVHFGSGGDVVNVLATPASFTTNLIGHATTTFNVGNAGTVGNIKGILNIENPPSFNTINVDDSADAGGHTVVLSSFTPSGDSEFGSITGLAPGTINYEFADTTSVTVSTGNGADTVTVLRTGVPTTLNTNGGNDTVKLGDSTHPLDGLSASLTVDTGLGTDSMTSDDTSSGTGHTYTVTSTTMSRSGAGTVTYANLESQTIKAGTGADAFVMALPAPTITTTCNGGGGSDSIQGPDATNTWTINAANGGKIGSKIVFSSVESVIGGSLNDTFKFTSAGSLAGSVNGGSGGTDKLDYSGNGGAAINVNLATSTATAISGGFSNIDSLAGSSSAADVLTGPNAVTDWQVTATNGGKAGAFVFTGVENLVGGTARDSFKITAAGTVLTINGGGGGDWLDYSAFTTNISVNLSTGAATNVSGGAAGKISNIQNVLAGKGNDTLVGNAVGNILIGNDGADTITGGTGRSILIGSKNAVGTDTVTGGSNDDIIIGGYTTFDSSTDAHRAALASILAEWQSANSYSVRISHIRSGGGLNGSNKFNSTTVKDDTTADVLTGNAGLDWFWANTGTTDTITDLNNGGAETVN